MSLQRKSVVQKVFGISPLHSRFSFRKTRMFSSSLDWPVSDVRSEFVRYFEKKHGHVNYKSSPCAPLNDPTLLFTNAGMNQFKPIFMGTVDPTSPLASLKRAVNSQKCIRAGGKHNDLDDVGKDTYHHTFFEMLGTWSFGDYFKKEAIDMAYDILVNVYKLDPNRLYASYFGGDSAMGLPCDTEARDFWLKYLPAERVLPFDKKANFWEMGETGPCGPCSEIHFDRIGNRDAAHLVNADDPNVIEIWNLVFIQFNREPDGSLRSLPSKHIDTGMGLERLTSILQRKLSNYDTDVFLPIFAAIEKSIGCAPYTGLIGVDDAKQNYRDTAYRVVADHIRTLTFSIADGAVPSNEGRGYVLRRILRRAVRYGMQTLGASPGFLSALVPTVVTNFSGAFPELREKEAFVMTIICEEESAFANLLGKGVKYFQEVANQAKMDAAPGTTPTISGDKAFFLYDTLGFPLDLTQIMAGEQGVTVDTNAFEAAMALQKERGRRAYKAKQLEGRVPLALGAEQVAHLQKVLRLPVTQDKMKYEASGAMASTVCALYSSTLGFVFSAGDTVGEIRSSGDWSIGIIMQETPFYSEAGGQVADTGHLTFQLPNDHGVLVLEVIDVQSYGGYVLHTCILPSANDDDNKSHIHEFGSVTSNINEVRAKLDELKSGARVTADVDFARRSRVAPNHSMTHVLNWALQDVLQKSSGNDKNLHAHMKIEQRGSLVSEEKLRFDFSFSRAVSANEIIEIEDHVNDIIRRELPVHNDLVKLSDAQQIAGLRAVFGEVYPDPVRVLSIGPSIASLIEAPSDASWAQYSVEFCGGTHLRNTREAQAFAIIEETAVAKGIRRITAVTGQDAVQTITRSEVFVKSVAAFEQDVTDVTSSTNLAQQIPLLENRLSGLRSDLDGQSLRQVTKIQCRDRLDAALRQLLSLRNKIISEKVDGILANVIEEAKTLESTGVKTAVFVVPMSNDAKVMKRTMDELKKAVPKLSFICIASADAEKLPVFALVTDELTKSTGLKANEWVQAVVGPLGGRGGGKASNAQGTVMIADSQPPSMDLVTRLQQASRDFVINFVN